MLWNSFMSSKQHMSRHISNSNIWNNKDTTQNKEVKRMFEEMIGWAVDEGADILIGETFYYVEEVSTRGSNGH